MAKRLTVTVGSRKTGKFPVVFGGDVEGTSIGGVHFRRQTVNGLEMMVQGFETLEQLQVYACMLCQQNYIEYWVDDAEWKRLPVYHRGKRLCVACFQQQQK